MGNLPLGLGSLKKKPADQTGVITANGVDFDAFSAADSSSFMVLIGKGAFGSVMAMKKKDSQRYFAIKTLGKKKILKKKQVDNVMKEFLILSSFDHRNNHTVNLWYAFQDKDTLYAVMDLMLGGSLCHALSKAAENPLTCRKSLYDNNTTVGFFPEERARFYAAELVLGIQFLHEHKVIHRDIKPDNILIDADGHVKITDFNVSMMIADNDPQLLDGHKEGWGTRGYRAPEIYLRHGAGFLFACDWWSLGATIYEMMVGVVPYIVKPEEEPVNMLRRVFAEEFDRTVLPSPDCVAICEQLLKFAPEQRLGCEDGPNSEVIVMTHPFFSLHNVDWDGLEHRQIPAPWVPKHHATDAGGKKAKPSTAENDKKGIGASNEPFEIEKYKDNFDVKLDDRERMKLLDKYMGMVGLHGGGKDSDHSSSDGGGDSDESGAEGEDGKKLLKPDQQAYFEDWTYNAEFRLEQNSKPEFSLLQAVSSFSPAELRQFVAQASEENLVALCLEIKLFRERSMEENLKYLSTELRCNDLHQKNLELLLENARLKAGILDERKKAGISTTGDGESDTNGNNNKINGSEKKLEAPILSIAPPPQPPPQVSPEQYLSPTVESKTNFVTKKKSSTIANGESPNKMSLSNNGENNNTETTTTIGGTEGTTVKKVVPPIAIYRQSPEGEERKGLLHQETSTSSIPTTADEQFAAAEALRLAAIAEDLKAVATQPRYSDLRKGEDEKHNTTENSSGIETFGSFSQAEALSSSVTENISRQQSKQHDSIKEEDVKEDIQDDEESQPSPPPPLPPRPTTPNEQQTTTSLVQDNNDHIDATPPPPTLPPRPTSPKALSSLTTTTALEEETSSSALNAVEKALKEAEEIEREVAELVSSTPIKIMSSPAATSTKNDVILNSASKYAEAESALNAFEESILEIEQETKQVENERLASAAAAVASSTTSSSSENVEIPPSTDNPFASEGDIS